MNNYGIKITKPNISVLGKKSPHNLIISSELNSLKIWKKVGGNITFTDTNAGTKQSGTAYYRHGLGYIPVFFAYYTLASSTWWWLDFTSLNSTIADAGDNRPETRSSNTEIEFKVTEGLFDSGGATFTHKYRAAIFVDPAQLIPASNVPGILEPNNWGMKISKPNKNVLEAKPHDLMLSSSYESLTFHMEKIVSFTIAAGGGVGQATFEHGLGYVPLFWAMISTDFTTFDEMTNVPLGRVPQGSADSVRANKSTISCDALFAGGASGLTYRFRVIVFKNKLTDV